MAKGDEARRMAATPLPERTAVAAETGDGAMSQAMRDAMVASSVEGAKVLSEAIKGDENPIVKALGRPKIVPGSLTEYPAKTYGPEGKVIPNKWNTQIAMAVYAIGGVFSLSITITREREIVQTDKGRAERLTTRVSVPKALTFDRKDAVALAHVQAWQLSILNDYSEWLKTPEAQKLLGGGIKTAARKANPTHMVEERIIDDSTTA